MAIRFQLYRAYADNPRVSSAHPRARESVKAPSDSLAFRHAFRNLLEDAISRACIHVRERFLSLRSNSLNVRNCFVHVTALLQVFLDIMEK